MNTIKKIFVFIVAMILLVSMCCVDSESYIPMVICGISFLTLSLLLHY